MGRTALVRIVLIAAAAAGCGNKTCPPQQQAPAAPPAAATAPAAAAAAAAPPPSCLRDVGQVQAYASGSPADPHRPTHTFSIVARDPATGALGVAVQSHWFAVGNGVTWAEAGVGAIATQSFAEPAYGRKGLLRMKAGASAPDA